MLVKSAVIALMGLAVAAEAATIHHTPTTNRLSRRQNRGGKGNAGGNAGNAGSAASGNANAASQTCLAANALQTGSQSTGQNAAVAAAGQVNSATDNANFINFCSGQTLTNGLQVLAGSCNGIPMGKIPANTKMVSTIITNPKNLDTIPALQTFSVAVSIANMDLGFFTNATSTYYSAPQDLNANGVVIGHTHVTIQDVGASLNPTKPIDAKTFVFFKGINDAGDGQGNLNTTVTGGLPAGNYRICTMSGASNHQPVLMPVAQRGAQEDCRYFTASAGGNAGNNAGGANNAASGADASSASSSAAAAATSASANTGKGGNKGGNGGTGASSASSVDSTSTAAAATSAASSSSSSSGKAGNKGGKGNAGAASSAAAATTTSSAAAAATTSAAAATTTSSAAAAATTSAAAASSSSSSSGKGGKGNAGSTNNASADAGSALGGIPCPAVTKSSDATRPFQVGADTFVNESAAKQRACAIQNNQCADAVNSGKVAGKTVSDCNAQETACNAA